MDISSFARVVSNMMTRYGDVSYVIVGSEPDADNYDPATGAYTDTPQTIEVRSLVFDFTLQSNGAQTQKGNLIEAGDKQIYIEPKDGLYKPRAEKDTVRTLDGEIWRIVTVKELNPTGFTPLFYELLLRK